MTRLDFQKVVSGAVSRPRPILSTIALTYRFENSVLTVEVFSHVLCVLVYWANLENLIICQIKSDFILWLTTIDNAFTITRGAALAEYNKYLHKNKNETSVTIGAVLTKWIDATFLLYPIV